MRTNLLGIHGIRVKVITLKSLNDFIQEHDGLIVDIAPDPHENGYVIVIYKEGGN